MRRRVMDDTLRIYVAFYQAFAYFAEVQFKINETD